MHNAIAKLNKAHYVCTITFLLWFNFINKFNITRFLWDYSTVYLHPVHTEDGKIKPECNSVFTFSNAMLFLMFLRGHQ